MINPFEQILNSIMVELFPKTNLYLIIKQYLEALYNHRSYLHFQIFPPIEKDDSYINASWIEFNCCNGDEGSKNEGRAR